MKKLLITCLAVICCAFVGTRASATVVQGDITSDKIGSNCYVIGCDPSDGICQVWNDNGTVDLYFKTVDGYNVITTYLIDTHQQTLPTEDEADPGTYIQNPINGNWYHTDKKIDAIPNP